MTDTLFYKIMTLIIIAVCFQAIAGILIYRELVPIQMAKEVLLVKDYEEAKVAALERIAMAVEDIRDNQWKKKPTQSEAQVSP